MNEYKFGELVKTKLAELGMSQNELAKRVHKGRSYINYVVTGKNRTAKNKQSKPDQDNAASQMTLTMDAGLKTLKK
jgi:hypothetical protein